MIKIFKNKFIPKFRAWDPVGMEMFSQGFSNNSITTNMANNDYTIEEQRSKYKSYGNNFTTVQINTINRQKTKLESANLFLEYGGTTGQEYFWQNVKYN